MELINLDIWNEIINHVEAIWYHNFIVINKKSHSIITSKMDYKSWKKFNKAKNEINRNFNHLKKNKCNLQNKHSQLFMSACKNDMVSYINYTRTKYPKLRKSIIFCEKFNDTFIACCSLGYLEMSQLLFSIGLIKKTMKQCIFVSFTRACQHGHLEMAKWLYQIIDFEKKYLHMNHDSVFRFACANGHIKIVKWLLTIDNFNINTFNVDAFIKSRNHLKILKFLFKKFTIKIEDMWDIFQLCCAENNFECAQLLYMINNNVITELAFHNACVGNRKEILLWLFENKDEDFQIDTAIAFENACKGGNLEIAEMLLNSKGADIKRNINQIFYQTCIYNRLEIAKFLWSFNDIDIHYDNDKIFNYCCVFDCYHILVWLLEISKKEFQIHVNNNYFYKICCDRKHDRVVELLISISNTHGYSPYSDDLLKLYYDMHTH